MSDLYIVCSKPLSGQYDGLSEKITIGDEVMPIPPDQYGPGFDGGMMPSGTQTLTKSLIDGEWYQETMPKSYAECLDALGARLGLKKTVKIKDGIPVGVSSRSVPGWPNEYAQDILAHGEGDPIDVGDWAYTIKKA